MSFFQGGLRRYERAGVPAEKVAERLAATRRALEAEAGLEELRKRLERRLSEIEARLDKRLKTVEEALEWINRSVSRH
jgi:hypothetical protein